MSDMRIIIPIICMNCVICKLGLILRCGPLFGVEHYSSSKIFKSTSSILDFKHCVSGVPISLQNVSQQLSPAVVHRKTRNVHNYIRMAKGASDVIPKNLLSHLANPRQVAN